MFYTTDGFTDNNLNSPDPLVTVKVPSASKSIRQFTKLLHVKKKTAVRRLGAAI